MSDQILSEPAVVVTPRQVRVRYPELKTVLIGAGVTIAVAAVLFAPRLLTKPQVAPVAVQAASHAALSVVATPATMQPIARSVIGDGSVVAWQEIVVGFESGGLRVVEVTFDEGDHVKAGQLLARLDDALPIAQLAEAEAAVTEADATAEFARGDFKRAQDLIRGDFMARQTLEQRQSATRQAEARLMAARARRDEAAARLAQTRVLAPMDGVVTRRGMLPGAVAQAGQEVARLIRDGRLELDARIPELDLRAVSPGQSVRVRHGTHEITGQVRAVAPVVGGDTRLGIVHIALPEGSGLKPGMFAQAEILPTTRTALTVPQQAVLFRDSGPVVFVLPVGSERVALRPITVGERLPGAVEVIQGLEPGDRVITTGAGFLSDGDTVRVATAS